MLPRTPDGMSECLDPALNTILNIMGLLGNFGTGVMKVEKALGTHWERH